MKFIFSQMAFFVAQQSNKRNLRFMLRFSLFVLGLILVYSVLFHYIMEREGHHHSAITGLYWTLTVMSTLGFGDITFSSDLGKVFSIVVLLSGVLLFMLVMPFTFIRYIYSPWLEAQSNAITPRELPKSATGHTIVVGADDMALSIVERFRQYAIPYAILESDSARALALFDRGYKVVLGELDSPDSYARMRAENASLVLALHDDLKNTNIAATVRETAGSVPLAASIDNIDSYDILHLAGCSHVFHFSRMLGESLARRVFNAGMESNIIGRFEGLCIAETPAHHSPLVGKSLAETDLRGRFGLNVAGIWQGNQYMSARPETIIDEGAVLLLAGTADKLALYAHHMAPATGKPQSPVVILGGGRVGQSVAETLEGRGIPFRVVEIKAARVPAGDDRYVRGSAADFEILRKAGIAETQTVVVTTHNDDLNIYLTIYCRKLRPEIQIISRSTLDRNVASLYSAGANLVMSQASLTANAIVNLLRPGRVFMLTEGLNIFRVNAPRELVGTTLLDSNLRRDTDCNVIAIRSGEALAVPPDPRAVITADDELILIGTVEAEKDFMQKFPA